MSAELPQIAVIGCGAMGGAMIRGWLAAGWPPDRLAGYDARPEAPAALGVQALPSLEASLDAALVVVAVKPHAVCGVVSSLSAHVGRLAERQKTAPLVASVAAGVTQRRLEEAAEGRFRVVRTMPNLAVASGEGMVACADVLVDDERRLADALFAPLGGALWLDNEDHFAAFTALVGSGPAYLFVFAEALADAAVAEGLPRALAARCAAAMLRGASALLATEAGSPAELKDRVASPSGTTIEGLLALDAHGFRAAVHHALRAAARRSRELS